MTSFPLPPHRIDICIPEKREPGMMAFNVRPGGTADKTGKAGWIVGVDQAGHFPLNLKFEEATQDIRSLPNGNLLFSLTAAGIIMEVLRTGETVRQWHAAGKWMNRTPPANSIEIDVPFFHHTINTFPNGNLLLLSAEMRVFQDWPQNDSDPDAPRGNANVVGDVILEVSPEGKVLNEWAILDILDPYRLCYGSCGGYWRSRGFPDSCDWSHANAITYNASDDSFLVSLRTQDCIVKIDRPSGELKWILGDHGNWKEPWSEKLLLPEGDVEWPYHQHDCSVTAGSTILCFDNGNFRATPFADKMPTVKSYSRAVEFAVDEDAMTVRQIWAYGKDPQERLFACYQGGAFRLPQTGNTFINYGGICTIDGIPTDNIEKSFTRARLVEVTPQKEIVFDMWIDAGAEGDSLSLSSFRSEFVADL